MLFGTTQEIDFIIELYLKNTLISNAPYRMTPLEKHELRKNLDELGQNDLFDQGSHLEECLFCLLKRMREVSDCALTIVNLTK